MEFNEMSAGLETGSKVRVKAGVPAPDLPEFDIGGWTGRITQVTGKKDQRKFFLEWDDQTVSAMDERFKKACESKQLYYLMSCLTKDDLEVLE
jgi:hypothetical protein